MAHKKCASFDREDEFAIATHSKQSQLITCDRSLELDLSPEVYIIIFTIMDIIRDFDYLVLISLKSITKDKSNFIFVRISMIKEK